MNVVPVLAILEQGTRNMELRVRREALALADPSQLCTALRWYTQEFGLEKGGTLPSLRVYGRSVRTVVLFARECRKQVGPRLSLEDVEIR